MDMESTGPDIDRMANSMRQFTSGSIAAVYGEFGGGGGELAGSGTFLALPTGVYLLSAHHVLGNLEKKYKRLGYGLCNGAPPVWFDEEPIGEKWPIDVSLVKVDGGLLDKNDRTAFDWRSLSMCATVKKEDLLFLHGYPGDESYSSELFSAVISRSRPMATALGGHSYKWFDGRIHISIDYRLGEQSLSDAHGLSGSAIWSTRSSQIEGKWTPKDARIVGVSHNWDQSAHSLVGTKSERIVRFLQQQGLL
jgi:hypothetical protein